MRDGLRGMLDPVSDLEVVGQAGDGDEALLAAHRLAPDVILMDLRMPVTDGVAATARVRAELPDVRVEVLELVAIGRTNRAIAGALGITEATVKTHLVHVYRKLDVTDRTAAVTTALDRGWITLG